MNHDFGSSGRHILLWIGALTIALLAGCSSAPITTDNDYGFPPERDPAAVAASGDGEFYADGRARGDERDEPLYEVKPGTGEFIDLRAASRVPTEVDLEGDVTLNFEGIEIQQVVKTVLGDIMQENYVIGPGVSGKVTFSTARPINGKQLMPILEMLLSWNNATLVYIEGRYHVLPVNQAIPGNLVPRVAPVDLVRGYETRAVPLKFIAPTEMEKLLLPYAREGAVVSADNARGLMILAGTRGELRNYMQTIEIFDVDWLESMSVGLFPLERVEADTVLSELETIFGESAGTPLAGMVRLTGMERLNAILAITPQPKYLAQVESWIRRLDRGGSESGDRLYVYAVKNVKATDLADTLNDVFGGSSSSSRSKSSRGGVAPGLKPVKVTAVNDKRASKQTKSEPKTTAKSSSGKKSGLRLVDGEDIRITAVEENNALLIRATPSQYDAILQAIYRLDEVPLQVMIEARLVEVQLQGVLKYGVQWFFEDLVSSGTGDAGAAKGFWDYTTQGGQVGADLPSDTTLFYTFAGNQAQLLLSALESAGNTRTVSAPSLMVLNNREAHINVGDQIPVNTSSVSSFNTDSNNNRVTNVQFRDTGVTLDVTPRVNPGGLVFMEISQEVSAPKGSADTNGNVTVTRREIQTEVAVQSGETIVIAGLMDASEILTKSGAPGLHRIPILGALFGKRENTDNRKELVIFITPTVVRNPEEARAVTAEYKQRFRSLQPLRKTEESEPDAPQKPSEF